MPTTMPKRVRPADFARLYLKSHSAAAMSCEAVLTFPGPDRQGDDLVPDGGDWAMHRDSPEFGRAVNYDHGVAIGRATRPDGAYGVELRSVADGKTTHTLPVGTTKFFQTAADCAGIVPAGAETNLALTVAAQAFELVAADVLTGISLEFFPDARFPKSMREIGRCPVEDRPAFRFDRWIGAGWAHALIPVNFHARTLLPAYEKALKIARDGRVGGRPLADPIRKSFSPLLAVPRTATVTGGYAPARKSMTTDELPPDDAAAMPVSPDVSAANGPTPAAMHETLQAMQDLKAMADRYATTPDLEHPGGKDRFAELAALLADEIGQFQADAGGMFPDAGFESAPAEGDEVESDADEDDSFPMTADGALMTKAFKKGYPRRFRKSDLKSAVPVGKVLVDESVMQGFLDALARALPAR